MNKKEYLGQMVKHFKDRIEFTVYFRDSVGNINSNEFVIYIKEN